MDSKEVDGKEVDSKEGDEMSQSSVFSSFKYVELRPSFLAYLQFGFPFL